MIGPELDSILLDNLTEKNIYMERGKCCILDFTSTGRNEGIGEETVMILLLSLKSLKPIETGWKGENKRRLPISTKSEVKEKDEENHRKLILPVTAARKLVKKILIILRKIPLMNQSTFSGKKPCLTVLIRRQTGPSLPNQRQLGRPGMKMLPEVKQMLQKELISTK